MSVLWHQDFKSAADVASAGGTITGSPWFGSDGVHLNGSTDYITYSIPNTLFSNKVISFVIEFTPEFSSPLTGTYCLYSTSTDETRCYFDSADQKLYVEHWDNYICDDTGWSSSFSPAERHVLMCAIKEGTQHTYWNGSLLDSSTQSYDADHDGAFIIGASSAFGSIFDGTIHSITLYTDFLTEEDAKQLYNRSVYNYPSKSSIWLDFDQVYGLGTVTEPYMTKDKSRFGRNCLLGDGSTANTIPSFSPAKGGYMDLDGTDNYLKVENAEGVFNNDEQTIVMCFSPDFTLDSGADEYILDSTDGDYSALINASGECEITLGGTAIVTITKAVMEQYWNRNGGNVLVIASQDGGTNVWFNRFLIVDSDTTSWTKSSVADIYLGCKNDISTYYTGKFHHFSTYPFKFGLLQVEDITKRLLRN